MMSFSKCGRRLNAKKQLVADDGTAVQANGSFPCGESSSIWRPN
jgi:hypothetical protein